MPYKDKASTKAPWVGQVVAHGKKIKKKCATRKEAYEWERLQKEGGPPITDVTIGELRDKYLNYSKRAFVVQTFEEKERAFRVLIGESGLADLPARSMRPATILRHFQDQAKARSGNAANKDRKNLSAAWSWGVDYLGLPVENPFARVKKQGEVRHERRVPTVEEFFLAYWAASTDQDRCMLLCYLHTGARRDELFRLTWEDVDFASGKVRLSWRKNRNGTWRSSWLAIADEAMAALLNHKEHSDGRLSVLVDPDIGKRYGYRLQWMRRLCKRAGVERFGFHGIRHLCASILAEKGIPLVDIQNHLRHDHLSTTEKYIHRLKDNRSAANALSGVSGAFLPGNHQKAPNK